MLDQFLQLFRDIPGFLEGFVAQHGTGVYALLFAIVFAETGLVVTPFLPGDSLLFAVGALCAPREGGAPIMSLWWSLGLLTVAAILGDAVNYHAGKFIGPRVFSKEPVAGKATLLERLLNRRHLDRAHEFYEKYGGKAVVLGRFVPIVRTFVPFVAGAGAMSYGRFVWYNVVGAVAWVGICVGAGRVFGGLAWVRKNFELVVVGIIVVSVVPIVVEWWMQRRNRASARAGSAV